MLAYQQSLVNRGLPVSHLQHKESRAKTHVVKSLSHEFDNIGSDHDIKLRMGKEIKSLDSGDVTGHSSPGHVGDQTVDKSQASVHLGLSSGQDYNFQSRDNSLPGGMANGGFQGYQTIGVGGGGVGVGVSQGVGHMGSWSASTNSNLNSLRSVPCSHSCLTPASSLSPGNFCCLSRQFCQPGYWPALSQDNLFCLGCQNWGNVHYL